jgi:hypothetical protein
MNSYARIASMVAALAIAPLTQGCANQDAGEQSEPETGSLSAAISAIGPDGATYSMPAGTYLRVVASTWEQWFLLDGSGTVLQQPLPAGSYQLELYFPGEPSLLRTQASVTSEVSAVWTDPLPYNVTIASGLTTPVALHFDAEGLEDITFVDGTLEVSFEVDEYVGSEQPGSVQEDGYLIVDYQYDRDPTAPYALELATTLGGSYYQGMTLQPLGPWGEIGTFGTVCAPVQVASISLYGDDGVSRRMAQMASAQGRVCLSDGGVTDYVNVELFVTGPAPSDQIAYLPEPEYSRHFYLSFHIGDVYDGTTLRQSQLTSWFYPDQATSSMYHYLNNPDYSLETYISGKFSGRIRLQP